MQAPDYWMVTGVYFVSTHVVSVMLLSLVRVYV